MKQEEVTKWERENQHNITGWEIDYIDYFAGIKTITFKMMDKSKKVFEIDNKSEDDIKLTDFYNKHV